MKNNILLFAIIFSYFSANSQKIKEKSITSKVKSATIFLNNAQVTRIKEVKLDKGIQLLKFIGLSPFIDKKSIQIKVPSPVAIRFRVIIILTTASNRSGITRS